MDIAVNIECRKECLHTGKPTQNLIFPNFAWSRWRKIIAGGRWRREGDGQNKVSGSGIVDSSFFNGDAHDWLKCSNVLKCSNTQIHSNIIKCLNAQTLSPLQTQKIKYWNAWWLLNAQRFSNTLTSLSSSSCPPSSSSPHPIIFLSLVPLRGKSKQGLSKVLCLVSWA